MLVVEDEAALASAVTDALRDAGYVVEHASDGEEALAQSQGAGRSTRVICDLKMPRLDGKAFYRTLSTGAPGPGQARHLRHRRRRRHRCRSDFSSRAAADGWRSRSGLADLLRVLREVLA